MEETNLENKPLILVVDDQPVNRQLLSIIMQKLDYPAIFAEDGVEALEKAESADTALILMDIQMPKMNGCQAAEILRTKGFSKPIIAVTSSDLPHEREEYSKAGMDDLIVKPFKRSDVEKILEKWLNQNPLPIEAEKPQVEKPAESSCAFDAGKMLEAFMDNKEATTPLLAHFLKRTEGQIANFPVLEKAGDWETARRDAHMIKGVSLTMGGEKLGKAASRLEQAYVSRQKEEIGAAYPLVCEAFKAYKKEAEEYLQAEK
jgi:CheY-like chemotaxis protein